MQINAAVHYVSHLLWLLDGALAINTLLRGRGAASEPAAGRRSTFCADEKGNELRF